VQPGYADTGPDQRAAVGKK